MDIDMPSRIALASAIEAFLDGELDNWEFDDRIHSIHTTDTFCILIRRQLWLLYDDVRRYHNEGKNALDSNSDAVLRRWVILLTSEVPWGHLAADDYQRIASRQSTRLGKFFLSRQTPKPSAQENPYWPLKGLMAWHRFLEQTEEMSRGKKRGRN